MLRIEKLRVIGFKSFFERTEVEFNGGITAVVGPNGCGKSNIGDAIHWVLGEQSARTLRGEKMEDVIFAGSDARKPLGMAEVMLRLTGATGALPGGREAVEVSRRLYRSGESEYLLDGQRTRLRDIQELLAQCHVGARTYAVIEQGKIDALLTARPKERRLLVEEAAGIIGYKQKKRLAEMKLEATEANLLRVSDILREVGKQIGSLKRQAARARRYRRLQEEVRALQRSLFVDQARQLDALLQQARRRIAVASDEETAAAAELARAEAAVEAARISLADVEGTASARREEIHKIELAIDRETNRRTALVQKAMELQKEAERLEEEAGGLEAREHALILEVEDARENAEKVDAALTEAAARRAQLEISHAGRAAKASGVREGIEQARREAMLARERLIEVRNERRRLEEENVRSAATVARLATELESVERERSEREAQLARRRRERREVEEAIASLSKDLARAERESERASGQSRAATGACEESRAARATAAERWRTLSDAATRFAGRNEGVGFILTQARGQGIRAHGVVADYLRAGPEFERAAEGYLAELLPAVLVEENEDVVRAVGALHREGAGRCVFMAERNGHSFAAVRRGIPEALTREPGVLGTLAERIKAIAPYNGLITERFDDAVLVEGLSRALELHARYPEHNFVTREGDVVYANGVVAGGRSTRAGEGLLAQTRAIDEAKGELGEADRALEGAEQLLAAGAAAAAEAERTVAGLAAQRAEMDKSLVALTLGEERLEEERGRCQRTADLLEKERERSLEESGETASRAEGIVRLVTDLEMEVAACEAGLRAAEKEGQILGESLVVSSEELGRLRSEEATLRERREGIEKRLSHVEETVKEIVGRRKENLDSRCESRTRKAEAEIEAEAAAGRLGELHIRQGKQAEALAASEAEAAAIRERIGEAEMGTRRGRERLDTARDERQAVEVEHARLASDREHLEQRCREEITQTIEEAEREAGRGEDESFDAAACESELARLRGKIESIGPVNMMALEQFAELDGRYVFLSAQKNDLVASIESLRESIRKINRSSREKFLSSFEEIRTHFNAIFRLLFGGGRAELRLEEGIDPLDAGLEVIAQPPGKRLQGITLLSGGEKALTAIALLFAIFRYQPSPFCLLDEVDAPLDEVNVGRFTRMLEEYAHETQFIVITHNRRSMEAADVLYGVTMPEPGVSRIVSVRLPEAETVAAAR